MCDKVSDGSKTVTWKRQNQNPRRILMVLFKTCISGNAKSFPNHWAWPSQFDHHRILHAILHTVSKLQFLSKNSTRIISEFGVSNHLTKHFEFKSQTYLWEKFCQNWVFGQKLDFSIECEHSGGQTSHCGFAHTNQREFQRLPSSNFQIPNLKIEMQSC